MPAYIITTIEILDTERYETYKKMSPTSVKAFGGRFIVRGGKTETLEGSWSPGRLVVLEFPSVQQAKDWYHSQEYADAKALRHQTANSEMLLVEGVDAV